MLTSEWANPYYQRDINNGGVVAPQDALVAVNQINSRTLIDAQGVLVPRPENPTAPYYDTTGDGRLVPLDVLLVINALNTDATGPVITVGLFMDTAPEGTNDDLVTSDYRAKGMVRDDFVGGTGIQLFEGRVNGGAFQRISTFSKSGDFEFDPGLPQDGSADGPHTFEFRATDGRFNVSSVASISFTLDTIAPASSSPAVLTTDSDTGASNTDGITKDNTPTFTVEAPTGYTVWLFVDDAVQAKGTASSPVTLTTPVLADGVRRITTQTIDPAGIFSIHSGQIKLRIDTQLPDLSVALTNDTGPDGRDGITSDPALGGTSSDPYGIASLTAQVDNQPAQSVALDAQGRFTFHPGTLADGPHTVLFTATDLAGNVRTADVDFVLDATVPQPPSKLHLVPASDTGPSSVDGITRVAAPSMEGVSTTGDRVLVFVDGQWVGETTAGNPWQFQLGTLSPGSHAITAQAQDLAGNVSVPSATFHVTIDTTNPSIVASLAADPNGDLVVRDPTITGTATDTGAGLVSLTARVNGGLPVNVPVNGQGQFTFVPGLALDGSDDGEQEVVFLGVDRAGNEFSRTITFTLDTTSPAMRGAQPLRAATDPVILWKQILLDAIKADRTAPPMASRSMARVHTAVLDAVRAIDKTTRVMAALQAPAGASADVAIAAAAHRVLSRLYPAQQATLDAALATSLPAIADGHGKTDGIALGHAAAEAAMALRAHDGWGTFVDNTPDS